MNVTILTILGIMHVTEIWKPCTLDPRYSVSSLGRFKTQLGFVHDLKPHPTGYIRVCIGGKHKSLHVLIALAFIPNPNPDTKIWVNHIDGDRVNNCVSNLEWVSPKENANRKIFPTERPQENPDKHTNLTGEIWIDVMFEGHSLRASNLGRVQPSINGIKTFGGEKSDGYRTIKIGKQLLRLVHRIICTAFHGQPPTPDHVVNHIDYNKSNNHKDNLEWVTQSYNVLHAKQLYGQNPVSNKRKIYQYTKDKSTLLAVYDDTSTAAKQTGTNRCSIVQMCNNWKNRTRTSAGGFYWEYAPIEVPPPPSTPNQSAGHPAFA
jgi:hypothetical protein